MAGAIITGILFVLMLVFVFRQETRIKRDREVCRQTRELKKQADSGELPTLPFRKTEQRSVRQS